MKKTSTSEVATYKHKTAVICEYPLGDPDVNIATAKVNGCYPESGWAMNEVSKEFAYVIEGSGTLTVDSQTSEVKKGDVILILPGEKFYWKGDLELVLPCSPPWSQQQYTVLE